MVLEGMMKSAQCDEHTLHRTPDISSQNAEARNHANRTPREPSKLGESRKDTVHQIRSEGFAEKLLYDMADNRVVDAAHILVEMANGHSHLTNNCLITSSGRKHGELLTNVLAYDIWQHVNRFGRYGKMEEAGQRLNFPLLKANSAVRMQKKRKLEVGISLSTFRKYSDHSVCDEEQEKDNSHEMCGKVNSRESQQGVEACASDGHDGLGMEFLGSNMVKKNPKAKANMTYLKKSKNDRLCNQELIGEPISLKAARNDRLCNRYKELIGEPVCLKNTTSLRKVKADSGSLGDRAIFYPHLSEKVGMDAAVTNVKPPKKKRSTLFIPTLDARFSFSIVHLLYAVRKALCTPNSDNNLAFEEYHEGDSRRQTQCKNIQDIISEGVIGFHSQESSIVNSEQMENKNLLHLTLHEIVYRVRSKPGDPCILEAKEPLQELIRGVLKIFSSKTAPPGAAVWKVLSVYEKSSKSWSWVGPVPNLPHAGHTEEMLSSEAWGLPRKTLLKLVDCFANWLKESREILQRIGSLPPPPVILMQLTSERFKDLTAVKSMITLGPSSEEIRAYFHKEEALRYSIPHKAFSYTALDGRKSTVAPLRRRSGKPLVRSRDHFMLKNNRPHCFTILCLVRDAAARMPGSIGTRADVCTLVRDSQFIMEEISDLSVNQVVSGALDRLHYERDPCVRFDRQKHLWVYLHGEREEEDFECDGTSSTRIRK